MTRAVLISEIKFNTNEAISCIIENKLSPIISRNNMLLGTAHKGLPESVSIYIPKSDFGFYGSHFNDLCELVRQNYRKLFKTDTYSITVTLDREQQRRFVLICFVKFITYLEIVILPSIFCILFVLLSLSGINSLCCIICLIAVVLATIYLCCQLGKVLYE